MFLKSELFLLITTIYLNHAARILGVFPVPSISHQVVFRQLTYELAKRGHQLVVITTDPAFHQDEVGKNITEIDVRDGSYDIWRKGFIENLNGESSAYDVFKMIFSLFPDLVELQLKNKEVQDMIRRKEKFDLLLIEACVRSALVMSHVFKAPVIQVSSLGSVYPNLNVIGAPTHPALYPEMISHKFQNVTLWEKIQNIWHDIKVRLYLESLKDEENRMFKRNLGPSAPSVEELDKNVAMLFLNTYPIWDGNRPVPPGLVYIGGLHQRPKQKIPKDIEKYLNTSVNGVIYMSLGTNVQPSLLPAAVIKVFMKVFSKLPYDVLLKWDVEKVTGQPKNVNLFKWLPQPDLLKHPNVKLFINQGGLQSTEEAISATVPMIAFPMLADQWYNAEKYVHFNIGLKLDVATITEEIFENSIITVISNTNYKENIRKLRSIMLDQPQSGAERAAWWVQHVLKHGGARHLRTRLADATWTEFLILDVIAVLLTASVVILLLFCTVIYIILKFLLIPLCDTDKLKTKVN